ncbi:MAG TPA: hypothetical protein VGN63_16720 [Flavisolibacter sp.]|jgi:hypothetical protein|nr:hypothetical protein [Flavisolibacter sp.]
MKRQFLNVAIVAGLALGAVACSNDGADTALNDTAASSTDNIETTTTTSTGEYAAMADSVERASQQGYYLNPRTGQPYTNLKVDRSTGRVTTEAGEPVWRYVDNRNWWVYSWDPATDNWNQTGEARMQNNTLQFRDDSDNWVNYDARWKKDDGILEDEWKKETENAKVKVEEDGDTKIKYEDGTKVKQDEDGTKIKTKDGKKLKVDEDGVKVDN